MLQKQPSVLKPILGKHLLESSLNLLQHWRSQFRHQVVKILDLELDTYFKTVPRKQA